MFGTGELIVILCVALLLFGGKRLPELARGLGLGLREFKKAFHGGEDGEVEIEVPKKAQKKPAESVVIEVEAENKGKSE
jgi:sec-independent protein translocase protein TatA